MYELIKDPIEVSAKFTQKGPEPKAFKWKNRVYKIKAVNFVHKSTDGKVTFYHFAVTANNETYKITFNNKDLTWILDEIYLEDLTKKYKKRELNDKSNTKYK